MEFGAFNTVEGLVDHRLLQVFITSMNSYPRASAFIGTSVLLRGASGGCPAASRARVEGSIGQSVARRRDW